MIRDLTPEEQNKLYISFANLIGDDWITCPICQQEWLEEHLEQHIGVSHKEFYHIYYPRRKRSKFDKFLDFICHLFY